MAEQFQKKLNWLANGMLICVPFCPLEISAAIPNHRFAELIKHGDDPFLVIGGRHNADPLLFEDSAGGLL